MKTTISSLSAYLSQIDFDDVLKTTLLDYRDLYLGILTKKIATDMKDVFLQYYEKIKKDVNLTEETQQQVDTLKSIMLKTIRTDFRLQLKDKMFEYSIDFINSLFFNIKRVTLIDFKKRIAQIPDDKIDDVLADYEDLDIADLLKSQLYTFSFINTIEITANYSISLDFILTDLLNDENKYIDRKITDGKVKDILLEMQKRLTRNANNKYNNYMNDFIDYTVKEDLATEIFDAIQLKIITEAYKYK